MCWFTRAFLCLEYLKAGALVASLPVMNNEQGRCRYRISVMIG